MDPSSSGGHSDRPRNNRSRGGRNRNQNRNRNRDRGRDREGGQGGRSSNRRPRKPEDDIMRERFPRPEPKPTLWQKILAFFGVGGEASKPAASPPSSPKADRGGSSGGENRKRRGDRPRGEEAGDRPAKKPRAKRPVEKVDVTSGRLYVGNLDYGVSDEDLATLFGTVGTVEKAEVVIHRRSGKSKGFAFVEMGSVEEAKQAVDKFHDQDFQGRQLLVCGAKSEGQREDEADGDGNQGGGGGGSTSGDGERPRRERKPRGGEGGGGREERGGRNRRGKKDFGDGEPEAPRKPKAPAETVTGTKLTLSGLSDEVTASDVNEGIEDIAKPTGIGAVSGGAVVVEFASVEDAQRALDVLRGKQFMGRELQVTGAADDQEVGAVPAAPAPEPKAESESEPVTEATAEEEAPVEEAESPAPEAEENSTPEEAPVEPAPEPEPVAAETTVPESETPAVESEAASEVVEEAPSAEVSEEPAGEKEGEEEEAKPSESQS